MERLTMSRKVHLMKMDYMLKIVVPCVSCLSTISGSICLYIYISVSGSEMLLVLRSHTHIRCCEMDLGVLIYVMTVCLWVLCKGNNC